MRHLVIEWIRSIRSPKHRSKTDVIFAFILSLSVTVALVIYIKHTYQLLLGPDDVGIRNIVSGLYTGSPEAHSYFMRYPLTALLSLLYKSIPHVYWSVYITAAFSSSFIRSSAGYMQTGSLSYCRLWPYSLSCGCRFSLLLSGRLQRE